MLEYVALRDIHPGDEIVLNYGDTWTSAWKEHQQWQQKSNADSSCYTMPFRHEIGVPEGLYPKRWMASSPADGDFIANPLTSGQLAPFRWKDTSTVVTPWAFRLGLSDHFSDTLLEYAEKMGISDVLYHLTVKENSVEDGETGFMTFQRYRWQVLVHDDKFGTNLHVFQPADEEAQENYYQMLSAAGFDEALSGIGETLGLDGLTVFHTEFWAVSYSVKGLIHVDSKNTQNKSFNIIVPLQAVDGTGPELEVQDANNKTLGRYKYEHNVAAVMGDGAFHATAPTDYRMQKQMRLAASIYVIDINERNVKHSIFDQDVYVYPPLDRDLLLGWAGRHWKNGDPTKKLPKPTRNHILMQN